MLNKRKKLFFVIGLSTFVLVGIFIIGIYGSEESIEIHLSMKNQPPSLAHWFGTDWLGRDMFMRTMIGLNTSMIVGTIASVLSVCLATLLGVITGTFGRKIDAVLNWSIDLAMGIPHIVLLILISLAVGGGVKGIAFGVAVTHWPGLTRIIRAEILQLKNQEYIKLAHNFGCSHFQVAYTHMLPAVVNQLLIGLILLFPHAILHESAITFLGYGLTPHKPAIGVILSEALPYITNGMWWLALFPGLSLLLVVILFEKIGEGVRVLNNPAQAQQ